MFKRLMEKLSKLFADTSEIAEMTRYISQAQDPYDLERRINDWERNRENKASLYRI